MLTALTPLDGRYRRKTRDLIPFFSELALIRYRLLVEIEYLIALSELRQIDLLPVFDHLQKIALRNLYIDFSIKDGERIKEIEKTTNHDVKSVEYFLREKLTELSLQKAIPFVHFALTSEDVNNIAYARMLKDSVIKVIEPQLRNLEQRMFELSRQWKDVPLLSLTHGQSATPTTVGKEMAVFATRLNRQIIALNCIKIQGKLAGATGTWAAHHISYPQVDWIKFSKRFVSGLGLEPNLLVTQIESNDSLAEMYHGLVRINNILLDWSKDMWMYISRGVFLQKKKEDEIGSSTMPHKINPIQFENAEGNLEMANAILVALSNKLSISRMQRDLSGSTVIRNQGTALGYCLIAYKSLASGIGRVDVDKQNCSNSLDKNWEILSEAAQTILRKHGHKKAYEKLKELTRGHKLIQEDWLEFVAALEITEEDKQKLLDLRPDNYLGLASRLGDKFSPKEINKIH